ncbi:HD domain-containing phosphohydrolase [Ideonella sp.]|jgi:HD-GYP domain-containing protein (c-di-GMP phosphodiesterase class II)/HAMP domain-containing protein|uniref:HD domain-containing phosphohydrolase n=1 Tax=Ideonella sp. TaxID=1929293 RepID=UPI0037BE667B
MQTAPQRRFSLHLYLTTLFVALLALVGGTLAWLATSRSASIIEAAAQDVSVRVVREARSEWQQLLTPAESAVAMMAEQPLVRAGSLEDRLQHLRLAVQTLASAPAAASLYVAYANGDFLLVRNVRSAEEAAVLKAPAGTRYAVQSIERDAERDVGTFVFLDAQQQEIQREIRPDYTRYDARERDWYTRAVAQAGVVRTEPYVFFTNRKQGLTLAQRTAVQGVVVGIDIELDTLSEVLRRQKLTPNTQMVLMDSQRRVLASASSSTLPLPVDAQGKPRLATLADLPLPALSSLAAAPLPSVSQPQSVQTDTGRWQVVVMPLQEQAAQAVMLALAVPEDELLAGARALRNELLLAILATLAVALPAGWWMARQISRPVHQLARHARAVERFDVSTPVDVHSMVKEVDDLARAMQGMKRTIRRFLDISAAVASEENFDRLMPRLLNEMIDAGEAAGGLLFLADGQGRTLELVVAAHLAETQTVAEPRALAPEAWPQVLRLAVASPEAGALAGRVTADELQRVLGTLLPQRRGEADHDAVAVPLFNRQHQLVGALLLLDVRRSDQAMLSFVSALSGTAAVSLETRELIRAQKELFESFIRMIASAIDAKSPYTGGHCARVPELTKMLARAACEAQDGAFADFQLKPQDWEAVHVGAWLHDCGKMTTPEFVVDKATKLETLYDRIHEIRMRFEVLKRDAEIRMWKSVVAGEVSSTAHARLMHELAELDHEFRYVAMCNEGDEFVSPERAARLREIGSRTWMRTLDDRLGISREERQRKATAQPAPTLPVAEPLLADKPEHLIPHDTPPVTAPGNRWGFNMTAPEWQYNRGELANLSVPRGTLTPEERFKINDHIAQTIVMLSQLPFPKHLQQVPEMAGSHHEKMDGKGYPRGLKGPEMSPVARMMALADVFEALTAVDRPYKEGKKLSEAIRILSFMKRDGHIDPDVFELFLRSGVYRLYAAQFMKPELIDAVDVDSYLVKSNTDFAEMS